MAETAQKLQYLFYLNSGYPAETKVNKEAMEYAALIVKVNNAK